MYLIYHVTLHAVCHHLLKSCDQKRCNSGDMLFLVTCHEHMFKELCEFMGGSPSH